MPTGPLSKESLTATLKESALLAGFSAVGAAPVVVGLGGDRLDRWLDAGMHGEMTYMERRAEARRNPELVLEGARGLLVVALAYRTAEPAATPSDAGRVSRYAWGDDYHDVLRRKLHAVRDAVRSIDPTIRLRAVVDSAPVMERDYAQLAGLGWIGKNTLLLNKRLGSWFFLGALLTDRELAYDAPHETSHCGTCRRCLDACPTDAFLAPFQLDPRRCVSYWTIERRSPLFEWERENLGEWLFGCDVCQDVCPWNAKAPLSSEPAFQPREGRNPLSLRDVLEMSAASFDAGFRGTPLHRAGRERVLRIAAYHVGARRLRALGPAVLRLLDEPDPDLREAARWALDRLNP